MMVPLTALLSWHLPPRFPQDAGLKVKEYELIRKNFSDSGNFGAHAGLPRAQRCMLLRSKRSHPKVVAAAAWSTLGGLQLCAFCGAARSDRACWPPAPPSPQRLWHQRAHRPGHQVRPVHRHLR